LHSILFSSLMLSQTFHCQLWNSLFHPLSLLVYPSSKENRPLPTIHLTFPLHDHVVTYQNYIGPIWSSSLLDLNVLLCSVIHTCNFQIKKIQIDNQAINLAWVLEFVGVCLDETIHFKLVCQYQYKHIKLLVLCYIHIS